MRMPHALRSQPPQPARPVISKAAIRSMGRKAGAQLREMPLSRLLRGEIDERTYQQLSYERYEDERDQIARSAHPELFDGRRHLEGGLLDEPAPEASRPQA